MKIVKCLRRGKNKRNVITSYLVCDTLGNKHLYSAAELKNLIATKQLSCVNLKLTSDGRLIGVKEQNNVSAREAAAKAEQERLLDLYRKYQNVLNRHIIMGQPITPSAEYRVIDGKVQLYRVLQKEGEFEIPEFVSEIAEYAFCTVTSLKVRNKSAATSMKRVFAGGFHNHWGKCLVLDLSEFDTSRVTDMSYMFSGSKVMKLDLSNFDTSNVTTMHSMFESCGNLDILDLRNFNTSRVTNMSQMFLECTSLSRVNLSSFDTSNVTDMSAMFCCCPCIKRLDLRNFNTSKVTDMFYMFGMGDDEGYRGAEYIDTYNYLEYVNLTSFDTSNVERMGFMFLNCDHLEHIDVRHFKTSKCEDFEKMFAGCERLRDVDFSYFDMRAAKYTESMFGDVKARETLRLNNTFSKHKDIFNKVIEPYCPDTDESPEDDDFDEDYNADYYHDTRYDED